MAASGISFESIVIENVMLKKRRDIAMLDDTTSVTSCIQKYLEISNASFRLEIFN